MQSIALPGANSLGGKQASVLGFGCAALLGRATRAESLTALNTAFDAGVNFFDTARSYGYGSAEGLLGHFLSSGGSSRRDQVVLCTKFGISPAPRNWKHLVKPVARAAVRLVPSLRQAAQRQAANQLTGGQFTVSTLRHSFEQSLRELRTDYADMLLLHDAPASVLKNTDLLEAMARLVEEGKAGMAGISAGPDVIAQFFRKPPAVLTTAHLSVNLENIAITAQTAKHSNLFLVANHPFGGPAGVAGTRERIAALAASRELPSTLREKLASHDPQLLPELVFHTILSGTGVSAVIPAMIKPSHIAANVRAAGSCRFTSDELAHIRAALTAGVAEPELATI